MKQPRGRVWGFRITIAGVVIALLPIPLWLLFSFGCENPFNESSCAGSVYLWYLLPSIPLGFLVSMVGLVVWIVARTRKPIA